MSRSRNRPPKLESRVGERGVAPDPTIEEVLERSRVTGRTGTAGPGPTELKRCVERLVAGDRLALGDLAPIDGLTVVDGWAAITAEFGATPDRAAIDPALTAAAVGRARARVLDVARRGGRIALATSRPASLLTVHLAFARIARECGADVDDLADVGPIRADGRASRWLRWVDGVAVVTDGRGLTETRDGEAAREWLFVLPRPALVVADGPFAEVSWEAGLDVVALTSLDRPALAVAAARGQRCLIVPLRTDLPPRSYRAVQGLVTGMAVPSTSPEL
jgi:hypothetical protein